MSLRRGLWERGQGRGDRGEGTEAGVTATPPGDGAAKTPEECAQDERQLAALRRLRRIENRLRALQAEVDIIKGGA